MCLGEACNKVRIGECSSAKFNIQNHLKKEDALWSLLFNFASERAIRAVLVNQQRLKSNKPHQLLIFADNFNLLGSSPNNNCKKDTGAFVITSKKVGLEVNAQKIMCMLIPHK
jgi:hypothetical protein